ncbi:Wadjet anti-phage system protein JetD domain-containing protein [Frankia sp. CiP1_Cm_nod2]|uniref:Wadjet anti-phage system protein JetD domain-containing protein n=1 Tax=Frankia sp. CiP1_Cm_nod2 TaxID=2897161 RepID=UPI00404408AE
MVTFERYERFGTSLDRRSTPLGPGRRRDVPYLTADERAMYGALTDPTWVRHRRLEQERIPLADALAALRLLQSRDSLV